jgi:hypothetical protein
MNTKPESVNNYSQEEIPDVGALIDRCKGHLKAAMALKKFAFNELFEFRNEEYHRNQGIWGEWYNNWSSNEYDELKKDLADQRKKNEVKGVYIFYEGDKPVYAGISRKILRRLKNHFIGKSHNEASLVYLTLREEHEDAIEGLFRRTRSELPNFPTDREAKQQEMIQNWSIVVLPIEDNFELYLTEILIACELKTYWNSFETH